jgi:hypothetical protein
MDQRASRIPSLEVASSLEETDAERAYDARAQLREELRQIPVLAPWTTHVAHDPSFSTEMNQYVYCKRFLSKVEAVLNAYVKGVGHACARPHFQ